MDNYSIFGLIVNVYFTVKEASATLDWRENKEIYDI